MRELQDAGSKVAMVGDGINDSPPWRAPTWALLSAPVPTSPRKGDVVLMRSDLMDVARAIELSRATIRNIKQDLFGRCSTTASAFRSPRACSSRSRDGNSRRCLAPRP
ncbi:MAG: hypothetical protein ACLTYW_08505 [Collinsella sp.]